MNGIEAIELMKQGKIVKRVDCDLKFRINNNRVEEVVDIGSIQWNFQVNEEYEEYIEPKALTGWERVVEKDRYCYITPSGDFLNSTEDGCDYDDLMYGRANYFSTKEKAEEINFKQTLFRKLQRFSDENGGNEIDWGNPCSKKFFIAYKDGKLFYDWMSETRYFGQVYFDSIESVRKAIALFHDDLIKYFTYE